MPTSRRSRLAPPPLLALGVLLAGIACGGGSSPSAPAAPSGEAVFRVEVQDEGFHVLLRDPARIAEAEAVLAGGEAKLVIGRLERGDGGFNQPWSWHLVPATVELTDLCAEAFDGRPSDVEADLDHWVDVLRFYCPWGGRLVARVR